MVDALVFIANEAYSLGLAAALASVVRHTRARLPIYVVDTGLEGPTRAKLEQVSVERTQCSAPAGTHAGKLARTGGSPQCLQA